MAGYKVSPITGKMKQRNQGAPSAKPIKSSGSYQTMPTKSPETSGLLTKASSGVPKLPSVRPSWKRNQRPSTPGAGSLY